jgi:hypothetical protein
MMRVIDRLVVQMNVGQVQQADACESPLPEPATERPGDRPDDHVWWLIVARKP